MAGKRKTQDNNLVIVCEGTRTEPNYFREIRDYVQCRYPGKYSVIRVVPGKEALPKVKNAVRPKRALRSDNPYRYFEMEEQNASLYQQYKKEPVRFVREVQLFVQTKGFTRGWAVFDYDNRPQQNLSEAFDLVKANPSLSIAFSSYSFEEWILFHFEQNPTAFFESECKDINNKSVQCGLHCSPDDCHGSKCLAGRIRECQYIPGYSKEMQGLFANYLFPLLDNAFFNSAWIRSERTPVFSQNPVTTVDALVGEILDLPLYRRISSGDSFSINGTDFQLSITTVGISLKNISSVGSNINPGVLLPIDSNRNNLPLLFNSITFICPGEEMQLTLPSDCKYIQINVNFERLVFPV